MTENIGTQPIGTSVTCLFFTKSFTLVESVYPYSGKDFIDFSGNSDCTRNVEFFSSCKHRFSGIAACT